MIWRFSQTTASKTQVLASAKILRGFYRHHVADLLHGNGHIGIELGVAEGIFSERMISSEKFRIFFGVDAYSDTHDVSEYKRALKRIGIESPYKLLRMRFDEAYDLFEDEFFDFIYIDGYAHSGEEGGETILNWYKKLRVGGVMAGDDYHKDWPLVVWAVNEFVRQTNSELMVTERVEDSVPYCSYPSWALIKKKSSIDGIEMPISLRHLGQRESKRVLRQRKIRRGLERFVRPVLKRFGLEEFVKSLLRWLKSRLSK